MAQLGGLLIGLTGPAGCGKDTVAEYYRDAYGAEILSFATPIKEALNAMFGFTDAQWQDRVWKEGVRGRFGVSPRQLAQTLGTDWGRDMICRNIWINILLDRWAAAGRPFSVIPDVRFDNEAAAIVDTGGRVLSIDRPGHDRIEESHHASEAGVDPRMIACTIPNLKGLFDLKVNCSNALLVQIGEMGYAYS